MQIKLWCVARIIEHRVQLLDLAKNWDDPNKGTFITSDREHAFQLARSHSGLLLNALDGLPSESGIIDWQQHVRAMFDGEQQHAAAQYRANRPGGPPSASD